MTKSLGLSTDLKAWLGQHEAQLAFMLGYTSYQAGSGKQAVMNRIIASLHFISESWAQLEEAMRQLHAPAELQREAKEIGSTLNHALQGRSYSASEQEELAALVQPLEAAKSDAERLHIVQGAISDGKLSKKLAERMVQVTDAPQPLQADGRPPASIRFSWGACGFCGALGLEGGPLVAAAACALCGIAAE